MFTFQTN